MATRLAVTLEIGDEHAAVLSGPCLECGEQIEIEAPARLADFRSGMASLLHGLIHPDCYEFWRDQAQQVEWVERRREMQALYCGEVLV